MCYARACSAGIRNKAARGELRRGLPVGFVWGDEDGEVRFHPDEGCLRRDPHANCAIGLLPLSIV